MKKTVRIFVVLTVFASVIAMTPAHAQGTAFTYQGQLQNNGAPANGSYDITFTLFATNTSGVPVAGPVTNTAVTVTNGLFTVLIDFGASVWNGDTNWLEIAMETNGAPSFTTLAPRQELTPIPYAIYAENAVTLANGVAIGMGTGNTVSGTGTVDPFIGGGYENQIQSNSLDSVIAGGFLNTIGTNADSSFLGGGISNSIYASSGTIGGGSQNGVLGQFGTVGGGANNTILTAADYSVIAGGSDDTIYGNAPYSTIGGGLFNQISGDTNDYGTSVIAGGYAGTINNNSWNSFIGGGGGNSIGTNSDHSVIVGGYDNTIPAPAEYGMIGGGSANTVGAFAAAVVGGVQNTASGAYSTVAGGVNNAASGDRSFAAGDGAAALYHGSFVWADASGGFFYSTATNQFNVRAMGGVRLVTGGTGMTLDGQAVVPSGNYVFAYSTVQQSVTPSIFENATFNNDAQLNGWTHTLGSSQYLCTQTGLYLVQYTAQASIADSMSMCATVNLIEVPGSQAYASSVNFGTAVVITKSFLASVNSGSVLSIQFAGNSGSDFLQGGGSGSVQPSISLAITRIQ